MRILSCTTTPNLHTELYNSDNDNNNLLLSSFYCEKSNKLNIKKETCLNGGFVSVSASVSVTGKRNVSHDQHRQMNGWIIYLFFFFFYFIQNKIKKKIDITSLKATVG